MKSNVALKQRVLLAIAANCRAGGVRLSSMRKLADKVGASIDAKKIEGELMEWARTIDNPQNLGRILSWCNLVRETTIPLIPPIALPARQMQLAA